jgi:hypothetical protein
MKTIRMAGGLAALALTVGLSACGSSSSSGSSTSTPATTTAGLSRTALAARANTICATASAASGAIKAPTDIASNAASAAGYFDKVYPITDAETKELQALTPDAAAAADWQAYVSAQVAADTLLLTIKQKADAKDPSGLNDLKQVAPAGVKVAAAASKIGATTCASG